MCSHNRLPSYDEISNHREVTQLEEFENPPPYEQLQYSGHSDAVLSYLSFSRVDETMVEQLEVTKDEKLKQGLSEVAIYFVIFVIPVALTIVILFVYF